MLVGTLEDVERHAILDAAGQARGLELGVHAAIDAAQAVANLKQRRAADHVPQRLQLLREVAHAAARDSERAGIGGRGGGRSSGGIGRNWFGIHAGPGFAYRRGSGNATLRDSQPLVPSDDGPCGPSVRGAPGRVCAARVRPARAMPSWPAVRVQGAGGFRMQPAPPRDEQEEQRGSIRQHHDGEPRRKAEPGVGPRTAVASMSRHDVCGTAIRVPGRFRRRAVGTCGRRNRAAGPVCSSGGRPWTR